MKKKLIFLTLVLELIVFPFPKTITLAATLTPFSAKEWVIGLATDPATPFADPAAVAQGPGRFAPFCMVWEPLFTWESVYNPDGTISWKLIGVLGKSQEYVDKLHWRVQLKQGVRWQNGTEFTAEDVQYSFISYRDEPKLTQARYLKRIAEVKIIDRYTVEVVLKEPDPLMIGNQYHSLMLPKFRGNTQASIKAFQKNPVGTGPYKLVEYEMGKPVRLQAWKDYRDGVPNPEFVTLKYIPEPTARTSSLLAGEVDFIDVPPVPQIAYIKSKPDFDVMSVKGGQRIFYYFQWLKPPFNDVRVRKALNYAVDRNTIVNKIMEGRGMVATSVLWDGIPGGDIDRKPYPYDPNKAKQLLAQAGYPNGFEFTLQCTSGEYVKDLEIAQAMQAYLAQVGVKMNLKVMEMGTMYDYQFAGKFDMTQSWWFNQPMNPDGILTWALIRLYDENKVSGGVLPEEVVKMRTLKGQAARSFDPKERAEIWRQINTMLYDFASELFVQIEDCSYAYNRAKIGEWKPVFYYGPTRPRWYDWSSVRPK